MISWKEGGDAVMGPGVFCVAAHHNDAAALKEAADGALARWSGMTDPIQHILTTTRRIAVVGASNKPERPSNEVMAFLVAQLTAHGFDPVEAGIRGYALLAVGLSEVHPVEGLDRGVLRNGLLTLLCER